MNTALLLRVSGKNQMGECVGYVDYPFDYANKSRPIKISIPRFDKMCWQMSRVYTACPIHIDGGIKGVFLQITVDPTEYNQALEDMKFMMKTVLDVKYAGTIQIM